MQALTKSEKISLSTTEIAKRIRTQLKEEFRGSKLPKEIAEAVFSNIYHRLGGVLPYAY